MDDTWAWDGNNWIQLSPPISPQARSSPGMVYDSALRQFVLFGGGSKSGALGDTWVLGDSTSDTQLVLFPQVAIGGGYSTVFTLANTGPSKTSGNVILTTSEGRSFAVSVSNIRQIESLSNSERLYASGSFFPVALAPGATAILAANPANPGDPTQIGWARFEGPGGLLSGVATFRFSPQGVLKTIAGVLGCQPAVFCCL